MFVFCSFTHLSPIKSPISVFQFIPDLHSFRTSQIIFAKLGSEKNTSKRVVCAWCVCVKWMLQKDSCKNSMLVRFLINKHKNCNLKVYLYLSNKLMLIINYCNTENSSFFYFWTTTNILNYCKYTHNICTPIWNTSQIQYLPPYSWAQILHFHSENMIFPEQ